MRSRALMLAAIAAAAPPASAAAQSGGDAPTVRLDETVVTGTPVERAPERASADVDVVTGEEKQRQQETSLGASLDHLPGVQSLGAGQVSSKPILRGFSGNRVRVLSNGVGMDFQQFGVRHPPNLDPWLADRIEVVRGASSILYGSGALGGAVNVKGALPPSAPAGETTMGAETMGAYRSAQGEISGGVKARAAHGPFGISAAFTGRDAGGLETPSATEAQDPGGGPNDPLVTGDVPFTDFRQYNADVSLGYMTDLGQVRLRYAAFRDQHNFVVPDPPNQPGETQIQPGGVGQTLENDRVEATADLKLDDGWSVNPKLVYSQNRRLSNPGPPDPLPRSALPGAAAIDITRDTITGRIEAEHPRLFGTTDGRIGLETRIADQESTGGTALSPGGTITNVAAFAFETATFDRLTLNAGARLDYRRVEAKPGQTTDTSGLPANSDLLDNTYVTPTASLGARYRVTDRLSLTSNLGRGFRAPNLFELYANGTHGGVAAVQRGNPNLDPETTLSADASLRWSGDNVEVDVTGYVNDVDDYIFPAGTGTTTGAGTPIFRISQQDAVFYGADASVEVTPRSWLTLRSTVGYVEGELAGGSQTPLLPPLKARGEVAVHEERLGAIVDPRATATVRYAGSQQSPGPQEPFGQFDSPPPPFGTASTDAYALLDLGVGGKVGENGPRIDVSINNVLDTAYRDFVDTYKNITLGPGRNLTLKVTQSF